MAFRHPGQLTAPFNIMSSSAKGGYLTDLHTNFTPFVEINNFHEDLVITDDSVPMQGPFTNRWVGGRQHRHQEIVTGSMLRLNRAESIMVIADSNQLKVYGADHPTLHQARAILYRDGVAQRPLNIANIQFGTGSQSIGNYQEIYQVVQTVGRTTNPRDFAENSTAYQAFPERMTHEGDVFNSTLNDTGSLRSYTLPTRSRTKAILVNKFSAPGDRYTMSRGFLNPAGEEMSAYNAMPFRNLPNRTTLRNQLTRHSKQGGYESGSATTPSIHKVARNTKKVPVVINGTETTRQVHDNYFIQHPIPQTDLQYAWITQSVGTIATTSSVLYGYQPDANALKLHTASPRYLQEPWSSTFQEISNPLTADNLAVFSKKELEPQGAPYPRSGSFSSSQRLYASYHYSPTQKRYFAATATPNKKDVDMFTSADGENWTYAGTVTGSTHTSSADVADQFRSAYARYWSLYNTSGPFNTMSHWFDYYDTRGIGGNPPAYDGDDGFGTWNAGNGLANMDSEFGEVFKEAPLWVESGSYVYMIYHPGWLNSRYFAFGTGSVNANGAGADFHMKKTAFVSGKWQGTISNVFDVPLMRARISYVPEHGHFFAVTRRFQDDVGKVVIRSGSLAQLAAGTYIQTMSFGSSSAFPGMQYNSTSRQAAFLPLYSEYVNKNYFPSIGQNISIGANGNYHYYASSPNLVLHISSSDSGSTWSSPRHIYVVSASSAWDDDPFYNRTNIQSTGLTAKEMGGKQYVIFGEPYHTPSSGSTDYIGRISIISSSAGGQWLGRAAAYAGTAPPPTCSLHIPPTTLSVGATGQRIPDTSNSTDELDLVVANGHLYYSFITNFSTDSNKLQVGKLTSGSLESHTVLETKLNRDLVGPDDSIFGAGGAPSFVLDTGSPKSRNTPLSLYYSIDANIRRSKMFEYSFKGTRQEPNIEGNTYTALTSSTGALNFEKRYAYSTWRQIRKEDPVTSYFKKNNIVPITIIDVEEGSDGNNKENIKNRQFVEPPLTSKYKPLTHTLSLDEGTTAGAYDLATSYGNFLGYYNNDIIDNLLEIAGDEERTFYHKFLEDYLLGESSLISNAALKYIDKVLHFSYSEQVYPSKSKTFLKKNRTRENDSEIAGTTSNGYDRTYGTQRTFYKKTDMRSSDSLNSMGIDPTVLVKETGTKDYSFTDGTLDPELISTAGNKIYLDTDLNEYALKFDGNEAIRELQFGAEYSGSSTFTFSSLSGQSRTIGGEYYNNVMTSPPITLRLEVQSTTGSFTGFYPFEQVWNISASMNTSGTGYASGTMNSWNDHTVTVNKGGIYKVRFAVHSGVPQGFFHWGIKNIKVTATQQQNEKAAAAFWPMKTEGILSFPESASYAGNVGELMQDTDESVYGLAPVPSLSYVETTHIRKGGTSSDYVERLTEEASSKEPFADNYEDFREDFRGLSKDMSILPEYNLSDHVDKIVGLRARPTSLYKDILTADGATHTSSVGTTLGISDEAFFEEYTTTEEMEFHTQETNLSEDHLSYGMGFSTLDIDVSGIKKMRIKNGFYPITRTVQLGNILSSSFKNRLKSYENDVIKTTAASTKRAMHGLLKPFMSPGILYNSLKSGVAVDYPIYTASAPTIIEGGDNTFGEFNISTAPDFRLPFESLYIPSKLPSGDKIRFVSSFISDSEVALDFPYQFSWDGIFNNSKFELAMHNFLAESVDFFLEDGQLTSFKSKKQSDFSDDLDPNKSYYMDVRMTDIEQLNKFVEYSGSKRVVPDPFFTSDTLFMDAISGSDAYYACGISQRNIASINLYSQPKDFLGTEIVSVWKNYLDDTGWQKVQDIPLDGMSGHPFRSTAGLEDKDPWKVFAEGTGSLLAQPSVKMSYGSAGFHMAISDPYFYVDGDTNKLGAIHLLKGDEDGFKINSDGTPTNSHYTLVTSSHFSDGGQGSRTKHGGRFGGLCYGSLAIADDAAGGVYIASTHPYTGPFTSTAGVSHADNKGAIFLFHSKSDGFSITQGTDQTEYETMLTASFSNMGLPTTTTIAKKPGSYRKLMDMQHVNFTSDTDNAASGVHIILGHPSTITGAGNRGIVATYHVADQGPGASMAVRKGHEFQGTGTEANSCFGASVSVGLDTTGTKKEVYYFVGSDSHHTGESLISGSIHDTCHGRMFVFCSQSVPPKHAFNPAVHYTTVSASHATYITSSGDVKKFIPVAAKHAGFAYHVDGQVRYNASTGKNEVYAVASIPHMSSSNMNNVYLSGGLAFVSLNVSSAASSATWYQSQSVVTADYRSTYEAQKVAHRNPPKLLYGGNPNNSSHNLFAFYHLGGYHSSTQPADSVAMAFPSASAGKTNADGSIVPGTLSQHAIGMFTGSMTIPTAAGQGAVTFANKTISGSTSHQGAFVNKQHGKLFGLGVDRVMDPGYVSYTPPHFYGEAIARIKYKPTTSIRPTIREIFESATVENILTINEDRVATHSGRKRKYKTLTPTQEKSKMTLSSSLDLFGVTIDPGNTRFDSEGNIISFDLADGNQDNARWVVSTKYESPVLDSRDYDTSYSSSYTSHNSVIDSNFGMTSMSINKPKTPWTNYGIYSEEVLPSLVVRDSFSQAAYGSTTGSLLDVVGFEPETKKISKLAEAKVVEEALLILPYIERRNYTTGKSFLDRKKFSPIKLTTNSIKRSMKFGESDDGIYRIPDMIADMGKYHLPPRLDFLNYGNRIRQKFAMFFVKVDHTFDRDDLSDIWQGLAPKLAREMDGELFEDKLKVSIKDFFGVFGNRPPEGLKFAVLKVKKKAKKNYFKTTADSKDDNNFLVSFAGDSKVRIDENRSYNWPYDYFSLLEAAKIETTINMSSKVSVDGRTPTITSEDRTRALNTLLGTTNFASADIDEALGDPPDLSAAELKKLNKLLSRLPLDSEAAYAKRRRRRIMARIARIRRIRAAGKRRRARRRATKRKRRRTARRFKKIFNVKRGQATGLGRKSRRMLSSISPFKRRMTKRQAKNLKQMVNIIGHRFSWSVRGKRK